MLERPGQTLPASGRPYVIPAPMEDAPFFQVTLQLADDVVSARVVGDASEPLVDGREIRVVVRDVHAVVVVGY
ncbi:MAG: hypothetical protein GF320_21610 [Armatimonadia bacterium]|nr:hypothetical protein [Armatimonadia bacterium]